MAPCALVLCRLTPSSTCNTSCRPCSSRPSTPSPPRTSSTSRSCTSSWPGEVPTGQGRSNPSPPGRQPPQHRNAHGNVTGQPAAYVSSLPAGIPGSHQIVLLPGLCYVSVQDSAAQEHPNAVPLLVSGFQVRLLVFQCQMCC